jgi:hypothetical protein
MNGKASGIVSFGIKGGLEAGAKFIDALKLVVRLVNIGDAKSLACHPATTTHRQLSPAELAKAGVSEDLVRLSIGIEHIDDLMEDIDSVWAGPGAGGGLWKGRLRTGELWGFARCPGLIPAIRETSWGFDAVCREPASCLRGGRNDLARVHRGILMTWPGKILSGFLMVSWLASKMRRHSLALPYSRLAILDRLSPDLIS